MKKLLTFVVSATLATVVMVGIATILPKTVSAQGTSTPSTTSTTNNTSATYKYVAQKDDTYSQMARKAVQTYGINNKINLSKAKIIAAETNITQAAGSPFLLLGQKVEIKESVVKDAVTKAQKLTPAQEAAWNVYVPGVNFNTNAVGQDK